MLELRAPGLEWGSRGRVRGGGLLDKYVGRHMRFQAKST